MKGSRRLRLAMAGHGFMARVHTEAWDRVGRAFPEVTSPVRALLVGRDPVRTQAAATRLGFSDWTVEWPDALARTDIDLVDLCVPGFAHAEGALVALGARKHVLCEKPLANTVSEAQAMADLADAVSGEGVVSMVGFNYRRVPALALARELVAGGRLGQLFHVRAAYLQDWLADPAAPLTWRLRADLAGSGALGDLGSHLVDLARYLTGQEVTTVVAASETFTRHRPEVSVPGAVSGLGRASDSGQVSVSPCRSNMAEVTVDDAVSFLGRLSGGALATFEATRNATGAKNALSFELYGSRGSISFDLERLNELVISGAEVSGVSAREHDPVSPSLSGATRILVTEPSHPYMSAWWPPGHVLGWEHSFVHQARDLLAAIGEGHPVEPSFSDGLAVQRVLAAVASSAATGTWVTPERKS